MSIICWVQQKIINNYENLSKTNKLCKHKHNTKKRYPAGIYLFKIYNKITRTRCEICSKVIIIKKIELKFGKWKSKNTQY